MREVADLILLYFLSLAVLPSSAAASVCFRPQKKHLKRLQTNWPQKWHKFRISRTYWQMISSFHAFCTLPVGLKLSVFTKHRQL